VASVAKKGEGLLGEVKRRRDCVVWDVTLRNRDALPERVLDWIKETLKHPPG
jgi:nucleoside-triphosphatase THEP1